jgi:hypothetical protein
MYSKAKDKEKIDRGLEKFLKKGNKIEREEQITFGGFYVYYLLDPRTYEIFYIGKGKDDRLYAHESKAKQNIVSNNNYKLFYRIKEILDLNLKIIYKKVYFSNSERKIYYMEKKLIKKHKKTLVNLMEGGVGGQTREEFKLEKKIRIKRTRVSQRNKEYKKILTRNLLKRIEIIKK